jgi:hypothetical protein
MSNVRKEVQAHIRKFIADRRAGMPDGAKGLGEFEAVEAAYPGIPYMEVILAQADVDAAEQEAWWQSIEKTIDGEVIERALTIGAK